MAKQLSFEINTHGGKRKGAGRKKSRKHELPHVARARVDERTPIHLNVKLHHGLPNLRTKSFLRSFHRALRRANEKGLRVQQFAVEANHLHLIGEADDNDALARGVASLEASIVWALRKIYGYFGRVFRSRYHLHALRSPGEVRNALRYVLFNHAKHTGQRAFADVFSSIFEFTEIALLIAGFQTPRRPDWLFQISVGLVPARSWLQTVGWKRARRP